MVKASKFLGLNQLEYAVRAVTVSLRAVRYSGNQSLNQLEYAVRAVEGQPNLGRRSFAEGLNQLEYAVRAVVLTAKRITRQAFMSKSTRVRGACRLIDSPKWE